MSHGEPSPIARLLPEQQSLLRKRIASRWFDQHRATPESPSFDALWHPGHTVRWRLEQPGNLTSLVPYKRPHEPLRPAQIRVQVSAGGVNFRDLMIALGIYPQTPGMPSNLGTDYSGTVVEVGPGVDEFAVGDKVIALSARHLLADDHFPSHVCVFTDEAVRQPDFLSDDEAATLPTAFATAHHCLCRAANLEAGERVLIHSAAGGVGLAALQVARARGAVLLGAAGTPEKRAYLDSRLDCPALDSRSPTLADQVLAQTNSEGVDVILFSLGGDSLPAALRLLRPSGRLVDISKHSATPGANLPLAPFVNGLTYTSFDLGMFRVRPERIKQLLLAIMDNIENRRYTPLPFLRSAIHALPQALGLMSKARHIGKVIVNYPSSPVDGE